MPVGRRAFMGGLAAATTLPAFHPAAAQSNKPAAAKGKTLIKGGYVVSMDKTVGELPVGDVLIEGGKILDVGKSIRAADATVIDARQKVVLPGLIDTHRHTWETVTRSLISEGDLAVYIKVITGTLGPRYRPEDVYIGNLLGAVGALNAGITTMLDWSHITNSPAHADAAIKGLADSGMRSIYAYGYSPDPAVAKAPDIETRRDTDIRRIKQQYFRSDDQLMTMAIATRDVAGTPEKAFIDIKLARELGMRVTMHITKAGGITKLNEAGLLGPDMTFVHTDGIEATDEEYQMMAAHGGTISTSSATEIMSGHGFPSAQRWLKYGLRPSFSVDNETRMPADLFAQMRALVMSDHMLETDRARKEGGKPTLIPIRDVLEFATLQGARATGLDAKVGTLTPGKRADLILIDLDDISLIPATDPVATVVLRVQPANVSWVFVDGQVKKRAGKLVGIDLNRVRRLTDVSTKYVLGLMRDAGEDIRSG